MKTLKSICRKMADIERLICCVLLVLMLSVCFISVIMRYAFNSPLVWSEEIILTCLIWFGFSVFLLAYRMTATLPLRGFITFYQNRVNFFWIWSATF